MKTPTHVSCPKCHTPVAKDQYEHAFGEVTDYMVCPECDYAFVVPGVGDRGYAKPVSSVRAEEREAEAASLCSMSG